MIYYFFSLQKMKTFGTLFFILLLSLSAFAQSKTDSDSTVIIIKDQRLDELMQKQKEINAQKQSIQGYRIQIYFGGDRQKANDMKQEFVQKHPEMNAYVSYQQPNFKIRVGDFRTRLEASRFLKQIMNTYSSCFIVPEEISIKQLK